MSLASKLGALLDIFAHRKSLQTLDPETRTLLDQALEHVVEGTDPRIRLVPHFRGKLSKSILKSLHHTDELVEKIAAPLDLDSRLFVGNPYLRAFFYTPGKLKEVIQQSSELEDFCNQPEHRDCTEIFALLCMRKTEEPVLGMQLRGQQIIRDVKQTRVIFSDQHIQAPASDEQRTRRELKCCLFEGLVDNALARISALRAKRKRLEAQQRILAARLRTDDPARTDRETARLKEIAQQLQAIGYLGPQASLEEINGTLNQPERFIKIRQITLRIDRDGILRDPGDETSSVYSLRLSEVSIRGEPPRVVTLVKMNRDEIIAIRQNARKLRFPKSILSG